MGHAPPRGRRTPASRGGEILAWLAILSGFAIIMWQCLAGVFVVPALVVGALLFFGGIWADMGIWTREHERVGSPTRPPTKTRLMPLTAEDDMIARARREYLDGEIDVELYEAAVWHILNDGLATAEFPYGTFRWNIYMEERTGDVDVRLADDRPVFPMPKMENIRR